MVRDVTVGLSPAAYILGRYAALLAAGLVPALLPLYLELEADSDLRYGIGQWLRREYLLLQGQRADLSIFEAHAGHDTAWVLLDGAADQLPAYNPDYILPYYDTYEDSTR